MSAVVGVTGRFALDAMHTTLSVCSLMVDTANWMLVEPFRGRGLRVRSALNQFVEFGFNSLPIVMLICFLIGAILAMQSSYQLARFGVAHLVADLVGIAAMRELAPLMTAIVIAGRSGSAITAEIGSMKVAEEIDALQVMGLNVTKFLVVPKFMGMLLAVPMVTVIGIFTMITGGFVIAITILGMDPGVYAAQTADALHLRDMSAGLVKSVLFGVTICWVGIYRGFQVDGGAEGVGKETTSSVVTSIFLIVVVDMICTALFFTTA